MERTLAIIKPDAVERNLVGSIIQLAEAAGLRVRAVKSIHLSREGAQGFYAVHRERPFFESLTAFMSESPVFVMVLEGEEAISTWRKVMGATDPARSEEGTVRKLYGLNVERNSVHGSDSPESAEFEIGYFFSDLELVG